MFLASARAGPDRTFGVIFVGLRITKVNQHAVAHEFSDVAATFADDVLDLRMVRTQEFLQIFWIKAGGESSRAHEVAKHHRELPPFGVMRNLWARLVGRRRRRERSNGIDDFPPVADGQDSHLFQIVSRQTGQDVKVDPVVAKRLLVGLQAEAAQPLPDVHVATLPRWPPPTNSLGRRAEILVQPEQIASIVFGF